jgi:hypothetical protein
MRITGLNIKLPFGIAMREDMSCRAVNASESRVSYRCEFRMPAGWRGVFVRLLLRQQFDAGPADSLARLARAAEREFAHTR